MYVDQTHPPFTPLTPSGTSLPLFLPYFMDSFIFSFLNPLSPFTAAWICMGVGSSTEAYTTYQGPYKKKTDSPFPSSHWVPVGFYALRLHPSWKLGWLDIVQVLYMQSQPLCDAVISEKHFSFIASLEFTFRSSSCFPFLWFLSLNLLWQATPNSTLLYSRLALHIHTTPKNCIPIQLLLNKWI